VLATLKSSGTIIAMRSKIAIVILLIFCFAEAKPLISIADYHINFDYISNVLCINKNKPMSCCKGKCYLTKQLGKTHDSDNKNNRTLKLDLSKKPATVHKYDQLTLELDLNETYKHDYVYRFAIDDLFFSPPTPPPRC